LPGSDLSYRATKIPLSAWVGEPLAKPDALARTSGGTATVYVSWNGATQVTAWRVLAGPSAGQLSPVATAPWAGIQTAIRLSQSFQVFQVQALDAAGQVIYTSRTFGPTK